MEREFWERDIKETVGLHIQFVTPVEQASVIKLVQQLRRMIPTATVEPLTISERVSIVDIDEMAQHEKAA